MVTTIVLQLAHSFVPLCFDSPIDTCVIHHKLLAKQQDWSTQMIIRCGQNRFQKAAGMKSEISS